MRLRTVLLLGAGFVYSIVALKSLSIPFLWIFLGWPIVFALLMRETTRTLLRALLVNLATVAVTFGAFEAYAYFARNVQEDSVRTYTPTPGYRIRDDILGTAPVKGLTAQSTLVHGTTLVYDVSYSIGPDGLRVAPAVAASKVNACTLFFGCSFTFGEGLEDDQTMPYRVGVLSEGTNRVYNFAFHGYGGHQMLAALEHDRVDQVVQCRPTHIVYLAIPDHVVRAAGFYPWGSHDPRYVLSEDGSVFQLGHYDSGVVPGPPPNAFSVEVSYQLNKSFLFKLLTSRVPIPDDKDVRRWLGIVKRSEQLAAHKYPGVEFHVILWRWEPHLKTYEQMLAGLKANDVRVHLITDILPSYIANPSKYELSPFDAHPNVLANDLIARYILSEIFHKEN